MAKPLEVDEVWQERILEQVSGLQYGQVVITVHDGRIVQIDRTERKRYDAPAPRQTSAEQADSDQSGAGHRTKAKGSKGGETLRAVQ
ncbi:YezD family protein [Paenibacillus sp. LHD-117]|uniref:YezD family protein n=1 Tax=Paenibacillus sp. LHD-117 TaxID=3071412 RepID=UPI0027E07A0F|nr:YezD family protein [Paenibacillus sp. LHD-117]MDQ6419894.1 YezD family protein [Paenibacillus sp. LHD-117]